MDKAAIFFNEAIFSCSESTLHNIVEEQQSECVRRYESVHENLKMGLAATMVLSLIGTVLNGVMMVTVCRDQVSDSFNHVDIVIGEYFVSETWLKILFLRGFHTQLYFIFIFTVRKEFARQLGPHDLFCDVPLLRSGHPHALCLLFVDDGAFYAAISRPSQGFP